MPERGTSRAPPLIIAWRAAGFYDFKPSLAMKRVCAKRLGPRIGLTVASALLCWAQCGLLTHNGSASDLTARASRKPEQIELTLQRRDPHTGAITLTTEKVNAAQVGVVIVDMWNFHWCKTSTARVAALVPRMIPTVEAAHRLGMTLFWCPSDVADNYVGTIQHEAAMAVRQHPLPPLKSISCPPAPDGGGCTCGPVHCAWNYGWDAMAPGLVMHEDDFMPNDCETLYSLCVERGVTHLIYVGVHTQVCLLGKSIGLRNMSGLGLNCILARDLTDAHGLYDPVKGITPDDFTSNVVAHFERHLAPTINFFDELQKAGKVARGAVVDPVRITPWGTPKRPHHFENEITVTLTTPWETDAAIYYTLDDSPPTPRSRRYSSPFQISATTHLRAIAMRRGKQDCLPSEAYFVRLAPMPPAPDVHLADLTPLRAVGSGHSQNSSDHRFSPGVNPPQINLSNRKQPLKVCGKIFERGIGVHAPNQLVYELKAEYDRFVALAGVDQGILAVAAGSNLAMHPSMVFKIFIDGKPAAESPVMRMSEGPWRFDVKIPQGSRRISLNVTDAGDGNLEDLGDWLDAGFVLRNNGVSQ